MCGRYSLFTDEESREVWNIVQEVNKRYPDNNMKTGEVYPTNEAPVLVGEQGVIAPQPQIWGFPHFAKKGVIINARSETALEKKMFRESLLNRRCVIPTTGFFEWEQNKEHNKYLFRLPGESVLYLAGFYNEFKDIRRYVILTAKANDSVMKIHNRMPIVMRKEDLNNWITNTDGALKFLEGEHPALISQVVN